MAPLNLPGRYNPWQHASRMNLRIIHRSLPRDFLGYWHADSRTIVLADRLTQSERRCTLAHELVHVERGDTGRCARESERDVHALAARRLIAVADLALAVLLHDHEHDQADELYVDLPTLRVRLVGLAAEERDIIDVRLVATRIA